MEKNQSKMDDLEVPSISANLHVWLDMAMYKSSGYGENNGWTAPSVVLRLVVASSPEPMEVTSIDLYAKGVVIVEDPVPDIELWAPQNWRIMADAGWNPQIFSINIWKWCWVLYLPSGNLT